MKKIVILLFACLFMFCGCSEAETEKVFTVTFDSQGGTAVESQVIAWGEKAFEPIPPTKECKCEFDGWYLGDEKWSFVGYTVTEDITLTAKWFDCFDLNDKEFEILNGLKIFREKYTWRDIEDIQKCDGYCTDIYGNKISNEDAVEYKIVFKDGYIFTITIEKSFL